MSHPATVSQLGITRAAAALLGLGFAMLGAFSLLAPSARAEIDPMKKADPAPRYRSAPNVAPVRGKLVPVDPPATSGGAGVSTIRGGLNVPNLPQVSDVSCVVQCVSTRKATPGAVVRVTGGYLAGVTGVVFRGRNGWIRKKPKSRTAAAVRAVVPKRAARGQVFVVDRFGVRSNRSPKALGIGPVSQVPDEVFPIRGPFNFGSSGSRFGAGRSGHVHQGQDVGAACGTRLVSARKGRVVYNSYQGGGAGNYIVIKNSGSNTSFVYMHMLRRSPLKVGRHVGAGTPIGKVGNTGASFGCHLHFEYWVGPWYTGGKPIDPLRYLKSLRKNN